MITFDESHELLSHAGRAIGGVVRVVQMRARHLDVLRRARACVRVRRRRQHGGRELRHERHDRAEGVETTSGWAQGA
jgi:hypothetical protein